MLLNRLSKLWRRRMRSKTKQDRQYNKESFYARLEMERRAQAEVAARLKLVEVQLKNKGRIK
jgi:hypothetical protein